MSLESGFDTRKKNDSFTNRYSNYDSPAYSGLRYGDSSSATSMAGNEKENDNDNSVDYLLSMLSHSPSASKETTPVKQTPVKAVYMMYPSESSLKVRNLRLLNMSSSIISRLSAFHYRLPTYLYFPTRKLSSSRAMYMSAPLFGNDTAR